MTETLREYLTGGGRLNFDVHRSLVDAMASPMSSDARADLAVVARYEFDTFADGGDPRPDRHLTPEQHAEAAQAAGFLADYLEADPDPELDRMIQAAFPEPLARHLEAQTSPHRMHVGRPDGAYWSCDNCGATFGSGEASALVVTDRPGYSSLHRDIVFCAECVADAASEMDGEHSSR
ncbi:MAG: hypothetical protein U0Q22_13950 [Acidimicrobiales bacterium]